MAFRQQPQPDGSDKLLSKGNASFEFTAPIPYRRAIRMNHLRSLREDAESDSKSVQVPSLSADGSSRSSSINNIEYRSEADDSGRWLLHRDSLDEHTPVLRRSGSPSPIEELNLNRTLIGLGTLPDRPLCDPRRVSPAVSEVQSKPANNKPNSSMVTAGQTFTLSAESMSTSPADRESKAPVRQPTLDSELSDSDSESEEDSDDDDIPNDEWSGANDNIEAALYQAVYPDLELAAHLISTMYPTIVLSYKKKILSKVYSWQEKNIATCGTDSGTASTAKETSSQGTSNVANKSIPKRDRKASSPDDNIGDDEDDDVDESRRKRRKEKDVDDEPAIPEQRLACPFYKKDPVKYSAAQSGHKSCAGPGYFTITSLREHLKRVHRPVQCLRCYQIFPFKGVARSSAIAELEKHVWQEKRCDENLDSLKEGISDVEWSRMNEENKNRKGKGKRKVTTPEKPQSALEQWYEIWVILFPDIEAPPTPWYETPIFGSIASSLSQGQQHFLYVLEKVGQQKIREVRAAALSGTDEELMAILLNIGQKTFSTCSATYSLTADASTSSFSNINGGDPFGSNGSGSWQHVDNESPLPRRSSAQAVPALPNLDFGTQVDHPVPIGTSNSKEEMMNGREMNMDRNPQTLSPNAAYDGTSRNIPNSYNYSASLTPGYPVIDQTAYRNSPSGQTTYSDLPSRQVAYPDGSNRTATEMTETMWPANMFNLGSQGEYDMNAQFPTSIPNILNSSNLPNQWDDQNFSSNYQGFGGAP